MATSGTMIVRPSFGSARITFVPALDSGLTNSATNSARWWQAGRSLWVEGGFTMSGGGGGASEPVTIGLPLVNGVQLLIDTTQLSTGTVTTNNGGPSLGNAVWFQAGTGWRPVYPTYNTTSTIRFFEIDQIFAASQLGDGDGLHYMYSVPIVGW